MRPDRRDSEGEEPPRILAENLFLIPGRQLQTSEVLKDQPRLDPGMIAGKEQ